MKTRLAFLLALLPLSLFAGTIPGLTSKVLDNGLEMEELQASGDIADLLGRFEAEGAGWQGADAFLANIAAVTPEEVRAAMDKYARHIDFAVLGNVKDIDEQLLGSF
jgi:predicted Zn-dependent peptidase